jgi:hypothetical protein
MEALASYVITTTKTQVHITLNKITPFYVQNTTEEMTNQHRRFLSPVDHQYPAAASPDLSCKVRKTCGEMSSLSANALRQLATATETMTVPRPANFAVSEAMKAAEGLRLEFAENAAMLQMMHVAVTASLLADLVAQVKEIADCVDVLAREAHFKNPKDERRDVAVDTLSRGRSGPLPDVVVQCPE